MNIHLSDVDRPRRSMAGPRRGKPAEKTESRRENTPAPRQDRLEVRFPDLLQAEELGFIDVNGRRFAVSEDMTSRMRAAYEEMLSRNEALMEYQAAADTAKAAEQRLKALEKFGKAMRQAIEIARRIAKGGRVPPEDERFLMDYSKEMFLSAKIRGMTAKEHKRYDSVLDREEEEANRRGQEPEDDGGDGKTRAVVHAALSDGAVQGVSVGTAPVPGASASGET